MKLKNKGIKVLKKFTIMVSQSVLFDSAAFLLQLSPTGSLHNIILGKPIYYVAQLLINLYVF